MQVVFDIGNVLLNYQPSKYYRPLIQDEELFQQTMAVFGSEEWKLLDQGLLTDAQAAQRLGKQLPLLGEEGVFRILQNWVYSMRPLPGTEALLHKLEEKQVMHYYLSNYPKEQWAYTLRSNAFFAGFAGGLASWEVKMVKPNADIFQTFLSRYSLKAEDCVFIDDTMANVYGARAVGMDAFQYLNAQQCERELQKRHIL